MRKALEPRQEGTKRAKALFSPVEWRDSLAAGSKRSTGRFDAFPSRWLAKHQYVAKATTALVTYGAVKESCGSVALLHLGRGCYVIHDFGTAQAVSPMGKAAGQKLSVERG